MTIDTGALQIDQLNNEPPSIARQDTVNALQALLDFQRDSLTERPLSTLREIAPYAIRSDR